jgi:Flp pilus assembly pilin Flp
MARVLLLTGSPERGQDLVEYALLMFIVALGAVALVSSASDVIQQVWTVIAASVAGAI